MQSNENPSERRKSAGRELLDPSERALQKLHAYYDLFNGDERFVGELHSLWGELGPQLTSETAEQLEAFLTKWPLGRWGLMDLWYSTPDSRLAVPGKVAPLVRDFDATGLRELVMRVLPDGTTEMVWTPPVIQPKPPEPFIYDPTAISLTDGVNTPTELRRYARQLAKEVESDILAQGREIDRRARARGWGSLSRRLLNDGELRRGARRLYQRAVLRRRDEDIADEEGDDMFPETVGKTVRAWARELGVPLPRED